MLLLLIRRSGRNNSPDIFGNRRRSRSHRCAYFAILSLHPDSDFNYLSPFTWATHVLSVRDSGCFFVIENVPVLTEVCSWCEVSYGYFVHFDKRYEYEYECFNE